MWAGDRKGEQILKALVTEDTFQLERKFCDPIPSENRLRIMIASNNQWVVPVGTGGGATCVLDVSDQYAEGRRSRARCLLGDHCRHNSGIMRPDEGRAAMLYDLLHTDLSDFNVRAVPRARPRPSKSSCHKEERRPGCLKFCRTVSSQSHHMAFGTT